MKTNSSWLKQTLAMLLVVVTLIGLIPTSVIAAAAESFRSSSYIPGDVNDDGEVNDLDVNLLRQYIVGGYDVTINLLAADVNADGDINAQDVNNIRRHIAGGYNIELKPGLVPTYSVKFYDGDRLIDTLTAEKNQPLGAVPSVEKSSKANAILLGYFTDPECTQPFYAENPVTGDMNVYAKYEEMGSTEELNFTSFAQMDQTPDLSFEVVGVGDPSQAITLEVKDGSNPVELKFEATEGGYIVSAVGGFNEGCSYQLHLADGWTFKDKPETIRTASFSIAMEEVDNIRMSDDIVYIRDTGAINYSVGGQSYDVLTSELITAAGGSFNYSGNNVEVGDIVCLYVGVHPESRESNSDVLDPAVYVKVRSVRANTVGFEPLGEEDQMKLYDIPDNFPIIVPTLPTGNTGTVNISALDEAVYVMMMGEGYGLNDAKDAIGVGDYISLYVSADSVKSEKNVYFGEITAYDAATGTITYKKTTSDAIENSMDLYTEIEVEGSELVTEVEKQRIETNLLSQVENSGFAEDAAFMLADLVTKTNGFKNAAGLQSVVITDANGNELTDEQIQLLNLGGSFELNDDVTLTVELITEGDQLHFKRGVQLAIGIEAEFEVELESEDKIHIELSAVFVQEVMIDPEVKGELVYKKVLKCIPVPNGVKVGATIDIMSFTAFSFDAVIYTEAADSGLGWDSFKEMAEKELKNLGIEIPDELVEGAKTVKDLVAKAKEYEKQAKEIQGRVEAFEGGAEQAAKYMEDAASIYSALKENGIDWKTMEEAFGATNVASDLMDMMNLTGETGLTTEYYDTVQALMDRYCEMLEQESDWVTLVEQEMFKTQVSCKALVVGVKADFMVRADLSLAIGSNLEYEVGKRYDFWFKIGLFKPTGGSSSMDLIDERFAFQFYVMGRLGLRAGVKATFFVGLGTGDLASVGIYAELGPYVKLYGFFIYEYTKYRPANTNSWINEERMMGALYMEFGLYFILGFEAEALKLFEYSYDFLDEEIPLLNAGNEKFYYQFEFDPEEDEAVRVKDADNNSANGISMEIPEIYFGLRYVNLPSGFIAVEALDFDKYIFTLSNPNFTFDKETGVISVNVPEGERYMECDLTVTYKNGKLAFSTYDMTVTIPLVWTSLSDQELNEYYTASVRVGNNDDGYQTVWTKKVLKGQTFDLPTAEELKEIIGWNDYKYALAGGYGSQQLTGLTLVDNKTYDFTIDYKTYSLTVNGVQNANGSTTSKTFTAKFGETFDFSALENTGTTDYANGVFTKFSELTAPEGIDLSKAIDTRMAAALKNGVTATANYVDNSVTAIFTFTGIDAEGVTVTLRRGDIPALDAVEAVLNDYGMAIVDIFPAVGAMNASGTYQVVCGELDTAPATITFVENGGSNVDDITKPYGSLIGTLPKPNKTGYTFGGWYTDKALTRLFTETKMPEGGITLYAKWTANKYTVTFHANGGNAPADNKITVTYGKAYGELPMAQRTGYGFIGWFTAATGGNQITAQSIYAIDGNQTLYARWRELKDISRDVFDFGSAESFTYEKGVTREAQYTFTAASGETYQANEFTFKYKRQGDSQYEAGLPVNAGTYDVIVSRPADNTYAKFEAEYHAVLIINKAVRAGSVANVGFVKSGLTYMELELLGNDGGIYDLNEDAIIIFNVTDESGNVYSSKGNENAVYNIEHSTSKFATSVTVVEPNYEDWTSTPVESNFTLEAAPTTSWKDYADTSWYNKNDTEFTLTTAAQLAGLAKLVNGGNNMAKKTFKLGNDIDVREHIWTPIGKDFNYAFEGAFDGRGHTVSGIYHNDANVGYVGLFGYVLTYSKNNPRVYVMNVVVDDSFIYGYAYVGGIVGMAWDATIANCTNYAYVKANQYGESNNYLSAAGGIAGELFYGAVANCVNYGTVYSQGRLTGGIVGDVSDTAKVLNNANFGSVTGSSRVGGIVGATDTSDGSTGLVIYNNYNAGTVRPRAGSNDYIGAIVGRNTNDNGIVQYNYYLQDCAAGGDGKSRYAMGKEGGSVIDGTTSGGRTYYASSFVNPESGMNDTAGTYAGLTLIGALNAWVDAEGGTYDGVPAAWEVGPDGYPLPVGTLTSALRK